MAVRNQHARQSKGYIFKEINGTRFMFCLGSFSSMNKVRYAAKKASIGKLQLDHELRGVNVNEDGTINQFFLP